MRQFLFSTAVILSCFVATAQESAPEEMKHHVIAFNTSDSANPYVFSSASDIFNHAANKENGQRIFQRVFPTTQKFPFVGPLMHEEAGLERKRKISYYIFHAECHILRLEGTDIIHPFNYFW